mgnify:CR=1 FL=1
MAQEEQGEGWSTIDVSKPNQADTKVEFEIEEAPKQAKAEESKTSPKETQAEAEKQVEVKQQETKPTAQKEEQTEVAPEAFKTAAFAVGANASVKAAAIAATFLDVFIYNLS